MKTNNTRITLTLTIFIVMAITLTSFAVAQSATDYELASVTGIWTAVDGGVDNDGVSTVEGLNTNEIRWGKIFQTQKSGLRFDGEENQGFNEGEVFLLGTLTHMNWPIFEPAADGATLSITLVFNEPGISPDPDFSFDFTIDETPNIEGGCPDWHTDGNPPCDDMVEFPNQYGSESFTIGDKFYTLEIVGFVDAYPDGTPTDEFITREEADNEAFLVGRLSSVLIASPDITITKKTNDSNVDSAPGPYLYVGDPVTWDYIVQNTGNVTLTGIEVIDDIEGTVTCPLTELAPGDNMTCTAIIGEVTAGQYTNTATVTAKDPDTGDVDDQDTSYYFGIDPRIELVKTASPTTYSAVDDLITYTFTVTNTGNVNLTNVKIDDIVLGITGLAVSPSTLEPGDIGTATATYTIGQADIDNGLVENTATATGKDPNDNPVSDDDDATVVAQQLPQLSLVKEATAIEGDTPDPLVYTSVGDEITYNYTLTNNGNVTLYPPYSVSDDVLGSVTCPSTPASLAPLANVVCTATYTITQADLDRGFMTNIAQASAQDAEENGNTVNSNEDDETVWADQSPDISLVKTALPTDFIAVGDDINYTFTVKNTGNVTLTNVTLTDPDAAVSGGPIVSLAPGASDSTTFTATYEITQADIDAGSFTNTATVTGTPPSGPADNVTAEASATVQYASIALTKTALPTTYDAAGDLITYTFTASNDGNVTLSDVTISDPMPGLSALVCTQPVTLAPAEQLVCTATYTITQADVNAGAVINSATATGTTTPGGNDVSDSDNATVLAEQLPLLSLVKEATSIEGDTPDPFVYTSVGDEITYNYTLTNNGNVTLYELPHKKCTHS
jgi:uncharacterized repeat protein (TIGR01451 family)